MTTAPAAITTSLPPSVVAQRLRNAAWAFLWGGAMCVILALWLGTKYDDLPFLVPWFTALLGLAGISAAAFQFWLNAKGQHEPWLIKRPLLGGMAVIAGMALMILGVLLVSWYGRQAIGESVGAALFGILAIIQGFVLVNPLVPDDANPWLDALVRNWMLYRNVLLALGAVLFVLFLAMVAYWKLGMGWFPEIAATLLLSFLTLISALWLSTAHSQITPAYLRMLVLIQGGVAGLIITLATIVRVYLWRKDIFLDGLSGWMGEAGWRVWVCGYAGLFGLTLMFVSLLLARADIRNQPALRRTLFGYNALVTSLLVVLALLLVNIVCYAMFPFTFNWSQGRGLYTLSQSTKNLLASIKVPTTIYVTMSEKHSAYADIRQMLNNCQAQTNLLIVKYISPDRDIEEYRTLKVNFPQYFTGSVDFQDNSGRGLLIVKGEHALETMKVKRDARAKVPTGFIPERKLFESRMASEQDPRPKEIFNGEGELAKELAFLDENRKKRKVLFLQGNGELDINSMMRPRRGVVSEDMTVYGATLLVEKLKKENNEVLGLLFAKAFPKGPKTDNLILAADGPDKKKQVPEDCDTLIIAGAGNPLPAETLEAVERYLDRGGKMIVCLDLIVDRQAEALRQSSLEPLLKKYGLKSGHEFALHIPVVPGDSQYISYATAADTKNVFAQQFAGREIAIRVPLVLRPDANSVRFKAEPLFVLDPKMPIAQLRFNAQKLLTRASLVPPERNIEDSLVTEPLPVVLGISEEADKTTPKPRMVIFGDADFISNNEFADSFTDPIGMPYYDLFASALDWLTERPSVGMRPKESYYYIMKKDVSNRMYWWPAWLMLLGIVGLGTGMWIVRRR